MFSWCCLSVRHLPRDRVERGAVKLRTYDFPPLSAWTPKSSTVRRTRGRRAPHTPVGRSHKFNGNSTRGFRRYLHRLDDNLVSETRGAVMYPSPMTVGVTSFGYAAANMVFDWSEMSRLDDGTLTFVQPIYSVQRSERFRVKYTEVVSDPSLSDNQRISCTLWTSCTCHAHRGTNPHRTTAQ